MTPGTWHSGHNIKGKPFDLCESGVFFCRTALPLATMNACECVVPDIYRRRQMHVERRQQFIGGRSHTAIVGPPFFLFKKPPQIGVHPLYSHIVNRNSQNRKLSFERYQRSLLFGYVNQPTGVVCIVNAVLLIGYEHSEQHHDKCVIAEKITDSTRDIDPWARKLILIA